MKINAIDKMIIGQLLPQAESILVQMMARDIGRKIEISDRERETIDMKQQGTEVTWDKAKVSKTETEIDFSEAEICMLREQVDKMDKQKKIRPAMLGTCIKIRDINKKEDKCQKKHQKKESA